MSNQCGPHVVKIIHLPCGSRAFFDEESNTMSYRCETCFAVVGSIGQPSECKEASDKYEMFRKLGSKISWDYITGQECEE
jgi:hypothetical protein